MRAALYYAPAQDDPLWDAACTWLGRDAVTGGVIAQPDLPGIAEITADARRYGFHATLKPPMRLRTGLDALLRDAESLASGLASFDLPPLRIADLEGFLALRETSLCPPLQALADACVRELDHHRALPSEAELARRRRGGLPPRQEEYLRDWGYPYVFADWRFHMTLTRRLSADEKVLLLPDLETRLAPALAQPRRVDTLCVFTEPVGGGDFTIAARFRLGS